MYNRKLTIKENLKNEIEREKKKGIDEMYVLGLLYLSTYEPEMTVNDAYKMITNISLEILGIKQV